MQGAAAMRHTVRFPFVDRRPLSDRILARRTVLGCLAASLLLMAPARAKAAPDLAIHLRSDRMTLRVARAPQLYLAGTFDDDAVQQVRGLLASGKVSAGTDVYLDASGSDLAAGMALGEMFRRARLNTHLGAWHGSTRDGVPARPATCVDACAYAWLGGVYRWTPSGADRIGVHASLLPPAADGAPGDAPTKALHDYLDAMGVRPAYLAQVLGPVVDGIAWWKADAMAPWLVANNGRLPLEASYRPGTGAPRLELAQTVRGQPEQVGLQCSAGKLTLDARYSVGHARAPQLAARAMYAYFEVDGNAFDQRHGARPTVDDDALVFTREQPFAQLAPLLQARSLGVWLEIAGSPVRLGFTLAPAAVERQTRDFLADCRKLQPGYVPPPPPAPPAKPSFWRRVFSPR
jgi:hypothetical protein